jgi:hypothetical protein
MKKQTVDDIRNIINQIGREVDTSLGKRRSDKYFYLLLLLYSLTENFLKWLVATKILWDETCRQTDAELAGKPYDIDFDVIRIRAKKLSFNDAIDQAYSLGLIGVRLRSRLHKLRSKRNDYVHELWIIVQRKNPRVMKKELEYLADTVHSLIRVFNRLVYTEIGVDVPEVFAGL